MRFLYAAAAVAVLAFVGYFFLGEWGRYRARTEAAETEKALRAELFDLAGAEPWATENVRIWCGATNSRTDLAGNDTAKRALESCRRFGFLD